MKKIIVVFLVSILLIACHRGETLIEQFGEICERKTEILSPIGFDINTKSTIDFNGEVMAFQFVEEEVGYALLSNNVGAYVEIQKTVDGGETWSDLNIGIKQYPIGMRFKDENIGIITVHDVTGCPDNCEDRCVVLLTKDGGANWEEKRISEVSGVLYHPTFDGNGNLYANAGDALMKSSDNGESWETLFSSSELGFRLTTWSFTVFEDEVFISGKDGKLLVVDTKGNYLRTIGVGDYRIWDVEILDKNQLILVISGKVIRSIDGGSTWETVYNQSARIIGFDSQDKGLFILKKSSCPTDVYQVNDLIASTSDGGQNWIEAAETTTNLRLNFKQSQKMDQGNWYIMIGNRLLEIREE